MTLQTIDITYLYLAFMMIKVFAGVIAGCSLALAIWGILWVALTMARTALWGPQGD